MQPTVQTYSPASSPTTSGKAVSIFKPSGQGVQRLHPHLLLFHLHHQRPLQHDHTAPRPTENRPWGFVCIQHKRDPHARKWWCRRLVGLRSDDEDNGHSMADGVEIAVCEFCGFGSSSASSSDGTNSTSSSNSSSSSSSNSTSSSSLSHIGGSGGSLNFLVWSTLVGCGLAVWASWSPCTPSQNFSFLNICTSSGATFRNPRLWISGASVFDTSASYSDGTNLTSSLHISRWYPWIILVWSTLVGVWVGELIIVSSLPTHSLELF